MHQFGILSNDIEMDKVITSMCDYGMGYGEPEVVNYLSGETTVYSREPRITTLTRCKYEEGRETEKAILLQLETEDGDYYIDWFPKSQIHFIDSNDKFVKKYLRNGDILEYSDNDCFKSDYQVLIPNFILNTKIKTNVNNLVCI